MIDDRGSVVGSMESRYFDIGEGISSIEGKRYVESIQVGLIMALGPYDGGLLEVEGGWAWIRKDQRFDRKGRVIDVVL